MYICLYIYICIFIYLSIYICVNIYVYIFICTGRHLLVVGVQADHSRLLEPLS